MLCFASRVSWSICTALLLSLSAGAAVAGAPATLSADAAVAGDAPPPACPAKTAAEKAEMAREIAHYTQGPKFRQKIREVQGLAIPDARQPAIVAFLEARVLARGQNVLDLGCAAGNLLRLVAAALERKGGHGRLVGVEAVPGWVAAGTAALKERAELYEADIGDAELPAAVGRPAAGSSTRGRNSHSAGPHDGGYDLIMLNDVMEHVMPSRCVLHARPARACVRHPPVTRPPSAHA